MAGRTRAVCQIVIVLTAWSLLGISVQAAGIGPRDLFEAGGIGGDQLATLADGPPWPASGNDLVRQMLYRIDKDVRPADLESWSLGDADLDRLAEDPQAYRMLVFHLRGRVLLAERYPLTSNENDAGQFAVVWRCRMCLDSGKQVVDVFCARVPEAWKIGEPIDEPAGALAFFLKMGASADAGPTAYFLADRMAWYPPSYLGRLGMDVGLLDDVVVEAPPKSQADGSTPQVDWAARQLTQADHECFYQMLHAVGLAQNGQLRDWAGQELQKTGKSEYSVVPLFNEPQTQQGRLVELTGLARRILPVRVGEEQVRERFGIDEYYQVYLFTDDSQNNPIVFCLRELPPGLPTGDGPEFGELLTVAGFFFKTWSYPVPGVVKDGKTQRQLAPLLVGKTALWHPATPPAGLTSMQRLIGTATLLLILGIVWWIFRQFSRGDREFARRIRRRTPPEVAQADWHALEASGDDPAR